MPRSPKPSRLGIGDWFQFLSLWKERLSLSFSLFRVSTRVSIYLIRIYLIELQILQLTLLQILQYPHCKFCSGVLQRLQRVRTRTRGCLGLTWVYATGQTRTIGNDKKAPASPGISSQDQPGPCLFLGRHVSLMLMPYRRAKSLLLSLYTSVLMPFTSSTTSSPVSLSM